MQINYKVGVIPNKGRGIIAQEKIPKGTLLWNGDDTEKSKLTFFATLNSLENYIKERNLKESDIKEIITHGFGWKDSWVIIHDDSKYMNHSMTPNYTLDCRAAKDIEIGEEICDDYLRYEEIPWMIKFAKNYGILTCTEWAKEFNQNELQKQKQQQQQQQQQPLLSEQAKEFNQNELQKQQQQSLLSLSSLSSLSPRKFCTIIVVGLMALIYIKNIKEQRKD